MSLLCRHAGLVAILLVVAPVYLAWTWTDQIGALDSDGPAYLMMAQHYSIGAADRSVGAIATSFERFPPLYPLALSWLGAAGDLRLAHAATTVFFLLALAALYLWLATEDLEPWQGCLVLVSFAAIPGSWLPGLTIQSEYLYLLCSLLALLGLSGFERSRSPQTLYLAAIAVAAAALSRSIGIALLLPLLVSAWRAPRRAGLLALSIAAAPLLLWSLTHVHSGGYLGAAAPSYRDHPLAGLRDQLAVELPALHLAFEQNFTRTGQISPFLDLLGLVAFAGTLARIRQRQPDGLYTAAYLGLLAVWPYPDEARRLLWPLIPVLLGQAVLLARAWSMQAGSAWPSRAGIAAVCAAALCALPSIVLACDRLGIALASERPELRGTLYWYESDLAKAERWSRMEAAIAGALRQIDTEIPRSDCVLSIRPELINYFSHRHSTLPPPDATSDQEFRRKIEASGCRYVFMTRRTYQGYAEPMYPLRRMSGALVMVDRCRLPGTADDPEMCALGRIN